MFVFLIGCGFLNILWFSRFLFLFFILGSKKGNTNVPHKMNQKKDKECKKKHFSSGSKKNKIEPEELASTVTRSRRISKRPSNWWVVKSEQSKYFYLNHIYCIRGSVFDLYSCSLEKNLMRKKLNWIINRNIKSINYRYS